MNNFQIRKATPEDTQTIFDLIYKLAVYEKLENEIGRASCRERVCLYV